MALKLRPARPRRRSSLLFSIPIVALPMLGLLVLIQAASLRSPLSEIEAPLAIAARYPMRGIVVENPAVTRPAAAALVGISPRLLGTDEFSLRSIGLLVGCVALGFVVWLGERLSTTRTGVVAAALLFSTDYGRTLLGTEFGVKPFYLLAIVMAMGAVRNLANDRQSLVRAGIAGGTAIALVGPAAAWIPLFAITWLRILHGLSWRSAAIALGTTVGTTALLILVSTLLVGIEPLPTLEPVPPLLASAREFGGQALDLVPILPLAILGLRNAPKRWRRLGSPRFLLAWVALGTATLFVFGATEPLWLALAMASSVLAGWAIGRATRRRLALAVGACMILAVGSAAFGPRRFDVDRWAVRETGKFVRRNLAADAAIGAPNAARSRLAYYATRSIDAAEGPADDLAGLDYVLVDRRAIDGISSTDALDSRPPRELDLGPHRLEVIAEFGSWVLARVDPT